MGLRSREFASAILFFLPLFDFVRYLSGKSSVSTVQRFCKVGRWEIEVAESSYCLVLVKIQGMRGCETTNAAPVLVLCNSMMSVSEEKTK